MLIGEQIFDLDEMEMVVDYLLIREGWERVRAQAEDEVRQEELQAALDLLRREQTARKTRLAHRTLPLPHSLSRTRAHTRSLFKFLCFWECAVKQTRLRSQLPSALQSEGASPMDSLVASPRGDSPPMQPNSAGATRMPSPRVARKGKEKEKETESAERETNKDKAKRPTGSGSAKKQEKEDLWKKIAGWYATAKAMFVPLVKQWSATIMERTVGFCEWLAEKHLEKSTTATLIVPHLLA
jgi:hypothetical protein